MAPSSIPCHGIVRLIYSFLTNRECTTGETKPYLKSHRVGVGYLYADFGETYAFLTIFLETFKDFSNRPLHLAGESYAVSPRRY